MGEKKMWRMPDSTYTIQVFPVLPNKHQIKTPNNNIYSHLHFATSLSQGITKPAVGTQWWISKVCLDTFGKNSHH